ncbi:MAG: DNA repair protein RecO [Armatimonadota bacterium]
MSKTYTATGIALIARPFRGTGRIVTFYTRERGLVEAAAQGIGKPGSSLAAAVEPFTLATLFLVTGRGADRLTQARVIESFYQLRCDMARYAYAAAACELVLRTTEPGQSLPGLFEMLEAYLRAMEGSEDPRLLSWAFELAYLAMAGLAPVIDRCVACDAPTAGGTYLASEGGVVCGGCAPPVGGGIAISAGTARSLGALRAFDLDRLGRLRLPRATREQIEALLRQHIGYHLDLTLKADRFVESLARWRPPRPRPREGESEVDGGGQDDQ